MTLKEKIATAATNLNLTEQVFVTTGVDRRRMRPAPGTILLEVVSRHGETLILDSIPADKPAPRGPFYINGKPTTYVSVGVTGRAHQSFRFDLAYPPFPLPEHITEKARFGASHVNAWWSCEKESHE